MAINLIRYTAVALITASLAAVAQWADAQITLSQGAGWPSRPSVKVELLRAAVVREFSRDPNRYKRLSVEFAIGKGWLVDSVASRDNIELTSEPLKVNLYGSFSIYLKRLSYRECYSLVNDSASLSRFDDVWLNERPVSGVAQKPADKSGCISEWPLQAGKNFLRYHAH